MSAGRIAVGHPVDVASGVMFGHHPDASIPGRAPLVWTRHYSTALLAEESSFLGPGWRIPYFASLTVGDRQLTFVSPSGSTVEWKEPFDRLDRGEVLRDLSSCTEVARESEQLVVATWDVERLTGVTRYVFERRMEGSWQLQAVESAAGDRLDFTFDPSGRPALIRQRREGCAFRLEYGRHGLLTLVHGVAANAASLELARFRYDAAGRLIEALDVLGSPARYEYDDQGRMIRETPRGAGPFSFRYDAEGRCVMTAGPAGLASRNLRYKFPITQVTDSRGGVWTYECRATGQVALEITPLGLQTQTEYDEFDRVLSVTGPSGKSRRFEYDDVGNRIAIIDAAGRATRFEFNARRQMVAMTVKDGGVYRIGFDGRFRAISATNPAGDTWHYRHDSRGNVIEARDPLGASERLEYDDFSRVTARVDRKANRTEFLYDDFGRLVRGVDGLGGASTYSYDVAGRLIRVRWPDGSTTENEYDVGGKVTRTTTPGGGVWRYEYGECGRIARTVNPTGGAVEYGWGRELEQLEFILNENGERAEMGYDADGRTVRVRDFAGRERLNEYDPDGRLKATALSGEATGYAWDDVGNLLALLLSDGSKVEFQYDALGRVVEAANASCTVSFERDSVGRVIRETCGDSFVESVRNALGDRTRTVTSLGRVTDLEYAPDQQVVRIRIDERDQARFVYDPLGREIERQFPNGVRRLQSFDAMGRLTRQQVGAFTSSAPAGRTSPTRSAVDRHFAYRTDGNLVETRDDRWGKTELSYDAAGRLLAARREFEANEQFAYDPAGNIIEETLDLVISAADPPRRSMEKRSREMGPGNQTLAAGDARYEYDALGRLVRRTDNDPRHVSRASTFGWDALGQLTTFVAADGAEWRYEYDPFGRRIAKHGPSGTTRYVWDQDVVAHEIHPSGDVVGWTFLPGGHRPVARQSGGRNQYVITDHLDTPRELLDEFGSIIWAGVFSAWGTLLRATGELNDPGLRFPGQWHDAESGLHYNRFRYYAPELGAFVSPDPLGFVPSLNQYLYAPNPLAWIDPFGLGIFQYDPLDASNHNRPTGAFAQITPADLGTGSSASDKKIAGFEGGGHPHHHERGHLIGNQLGGSGTDTRNLATMTSGTNCGPGGMIHAENAIAAHVRAGNTVDMMVVPNYHGDSKVAHSFSVYAVDQNGKVIVDTEVQNGRYKNHSG